ncbi:hypothetical protein acdb102_11840 [Acidothermaceae bacterium B102]|nr:hypothetical protein acdb102_11840 [Acidothermaceae bacterium B102]
MVGASGSGKTTLARAAATRLGLPLVELDAIHHRAHWQPAPREEFRSELLSVLAGYGASRGGWVVDGNYRTAVGDLVEADVWIWLDYSRLVVMSRLLRRTAGRVLLRRELWNGNRESWRNLVSLDPDRNILLWAWTTHAGNRTRYATLAGASAVPWVRLRSPGEAAAWLATL